MNELTLLEKASTSLDFFRKTGCISSNRKMTESSSRDFWATQISKYQLKQVADTEMMIPVDMRGVGEVSLRRGRVWKGHSRLLGTVHEVPSKICVHAACT